MGFELNGNYLFYDKDDVAVERILRTNLLSQENVLGKVQVCLLYTSMALLPQSTLL